MNLLITIRPLSMLFRHHAFEYTPMGNEPVAHHGPGGATTPPTSGVASPKIWGGSFGVQNVWFLANNTIFFIKRLSKHKITIFSKHFGGHGPFGPPGYAYVSDPAPSWRGWPFPSTASQVTSRSTWNKLTAAFRSTTNFRMAFCKFWMLFLKWKLFRNM